MILANLFIRWAYAIREFYVKKVAKRYPGITRETSLMILHVDEIDKKYKRKYKKLPTYAKDIKVGVTAESFRDCVTLASFDGKIYRL